VIDHGRFSVLGVDINAVDYETVVEAIVTAAKEGRSLKVSALAVHGVMTGVDDPLHRSRLNSFDFLVPDGQPVRWALALLHKVRLADRVYGPELTIRTLRRMADEGLSAYFYGSTPETLDSLVRELKISLPHLQIAGVHASEFRLGNEADAERIANEITTSGARCVFVGLGCPRQEKFVYAIADRIPLPLLAVGAAFDYHAGTLKAPPAMLQRLGLEWFWRLALEPRRLWRRYVLLNPRYIVAIARQYVSRGQVDAPTSHVPEFLEFPI